MRCQDKRYLSWVHQVQEKLRYLIYFQIEFLNSQEEYYKKTLQLTMT